MIKELAEQLFDGLLSAMETAPLQRMVKISNVKWS
jgi:hypothetical protein